LTLKRMTSTTPPIAEAERRVATSCAASKPTPYAASDSASIATPSSASAPNGSASFTAIAPTAVPAKPIAIESMATTRNAVARESIHFERDTPAASHASTNPLSSSPRPVPVPASIAHTAYTIASDPNDRHVR